MLDHENAPKDCPEISPAPQHKPVAKEPLVGIILEYLEILVFAVCAVLILFTFVFRLCKVNGNSMNKTLLNGQMLITTQLVEPEQGDIIVFHMTSDENARFNEPLVKRIIAMEGQTVRIDYVSGEVSVDGNVLDEPYVALLTGQGYEIDRWTQTPGHHFNYATGIFEATVPQGCLFVMGDNRNNSADSRYFVIGPVDCRRILGKVMIRVTPLNKFGKVE